MRLATSSLLLSLATLLFAALAWADHHEIPRSKAPEGVELYIIEPADGATVSSPVRVVFGLRGMGVAPAGTNMPHTGHHHLVIDAELPDLDLPVPTSDHYVHFGKGQTETSVKLDPGKHTLQLLLGDMNHFPHKPAVVSKKITITVE